MKGRRAKQSSWKWLLGFFLWGALLLGRLQMVYGAEEDILIQSVPMEEKSSSLQHSMLEDLEVDKVQEAMKELLGENSFQLKEAMQKLLKGEEAFSKDTVKDLLQGALFSQWRAQKETVVQVILLILVAALFANFTRVFENGQIGDIGFYMVYLLLTAILIRSFGSISTQIQETLSNLVVFMKALAPAYFLAITLSTGAGSAMLFYEMVLLLIYLIQTFLLAVLLPGINVYVLLELVNYLHQEDFLSKMAELLKFLIEWALKTCLAVVVGMQVVQSMIAPALDTLKRTIIGKGASAIPGIGNAVNAVTEMVIGTTALVRNCLGVVAIAALLLIGVIPLVKLGVITFLYKFLAAFTQPISDARIVGCLSTIGEGCVLLFKVLMTIEILCMVTIAILATSFFSP